jgi:hypothetical protein
MEKHRLFPITTTCARKPRTSATGIARSYGTSRVPTERFEREKPKAQCAFGFLVSPSFAQVNLARIRETKKASA